MKRFILILILILPVISHAENEQLKTLPYLAWSENKTDKSGVTIYSKELSQPGFNLYCSMKQMNGFLIDMSGNIVEEFKDKRKNKKQWKFIQKYEDDSYIIIQEPVGDVICIDSDSDILWEIKGRFHHDFSFDDKKICLLSERKRRVKEFGKDIKDNVFELYSRERES